MIRVWKLGNLEYNKFPTSESADKLQQLLESYKPGELMDLIWGPDLTIEIVPDYPNEPITDIIHVVRREETDNSNS